MRWLTFVRWGLPAVVVLAGLIAWAFDPTVDGLEGAAHIIGAGLAILLLNLLFRIGMTGDRERDEEDAARDFYDLHGHWPDEAPPPRPQPPPHRAGTRAPGHRPAVHPRPRHRGE
jgi:hypothetical protein